MFLRSTHHWFRPIRRCSKGARRDGEDLVHLNDIRPAAEKLPDTRRQALIPLGILFVEGDALAACGCAATTGADGPELQAARESVAMIAAGKRIGRDANIRWPPSGIAKTTLTAQIGRAHV